MEQIRLQFFDFLLMDHHMANAGGGRLPAYLCGWDCSCGSSDRREDQWRTRLQLRI